MNKFDIAMKEVFDTLLPKAKHLAAGSDRSLKACMISLLQPLAKEYIIPGSILAKTDRRTKKWNIQLVIAESASGSADGFEVIAESDIELVDGHAGAVTRFLEMVKDTHGKSIRDISELDPELLLKRFTSLRPTISRAGGRAVLNTKYVLDGKVYSCILRVGRGNIPLDIEPPESQSAE